MARKTAAEGRLTRKRPDGRSLRARRQRKSRRAQVLESALTAFAEKGYHAASITDIITGAGIARGTFYLYFESKRAVFEELLEGYLKKISEAVSRVSLEPDAPPPTDQLRTNVERVLDVLSDNQGLNQILLRQAVGLDADFDRKLDEFYGRLLDYIQGALDLGQQMGMVRADGTDTAMLAACVLGSIKELINQYLIDAPPGSLDRETAVRVILSYNLRGLLDPAP
jgi:AcrR family transcriptional regulator